jgi:hypothetical protein
VWHLLARFLRAALNRLAAEIAEPLLYAGLAAAFGGGAVVAPSARALFGGAAGGFSVAALLAWIRRWWEYRMERYSVLRNEHPSQNHAIAFAVRKYPSANCS